MQMNYRNGFIKCTCIIPFNLKSLPKVTNYYIVGRYYRSFNDVQMEVKTSTRNGQIMKMALVIIRRSFGLVSSA